MQLMITLFIIAAAAFYVGRTLVQPWSAPGSCGSGCGKCKAPVAEHAKPGRIPLA